MKLSWSTPALLLCAALAAGQEPAREEPRPPDVLLIYLDDVNDWVGYLGGNPQSRTPSIDRLAERGLAFTNAQTPAPVCNTSRTAVLSGTRPFTVWAWGNKPWTETLVDLTTLPVHFAQHGYVTAGTGKIFHGKSEEAFDEYFNARSKAEAAFKDQTVDLGVEYSNRMVDWEALDIPDEEMSDYARATWTGERLQQDDERPLFLAVGFHRPHLPWKVPKAYFDEFPLDQIQLPEVDEHDLNDVPQAGRKQCDTEAHEALVSNDLWAAAVQAYLAAVAFNDAQVGRVLDALDRSPRADRTIVALLSDHGWHLGEKSHWHKLTLWEESAHVPFIIAPPGYAHAGVKCRRAVDTLSLYATLCDLTGLPIPGHVEGVSLAPLIETPDAEWDGVGLTSLFRSHAIRTERYRYIRYSDGGEELYDHDSDPNEFVNLAVKPSHLDEVKEFRKRLRELVPQ